MSQVQNVGVNSLSVFAGLVDGVDYDSLRVGYIDKTGDYVIEPQFEAAYSFSQNGLAPVKDANSHLWGYIDTTGAYVIEPQFWWAMDFSGNGLGSCT